MRDVGHPSPVPSFPTCVIGNLPPSLAFPTLFIGNPSSSASFPTLFSGIHPHRRHSRNFLSGIYLGFLSDGSPPQTAGMTKGRWIPAPANDCRGRLTNCGYDRRGDGYLPPTRRYGKRVMDPRPRLAGRTKKVCHARHVLSGIHLVFPWSSFITRKVSDPTEKTGGSSVHGEPFDERLFFLNPDKLKFST